MRSTAERQPPHCCDAPQRRPSSSTEVAPDSISASSWLRLTRAQWHTIMGASRRTAARGRATRGQSPPRCADRPVDDARRRALANSSVRRRRTNGRSCNGATCAVPVRLLRNRGHVDADVGRTRRCLDRDGGTRSILRHRQDHPDHKRHATPRVRCPYQSTVELGPLSQKRAISRSLDSIY